MNKPVERICNSVEDLETAGGPGRAPGFRIFADAQMTRAARPRARTVAKSLRAQVRADTLHFGGTEKLFT